MSPTLAVILFADGFVAGFVVTLLLFKARDGGDDGPGDRGRSAPPPPVAPGPTAGVVPTRSGPRPIHVISEASGDVPRSDPERSDPERSLRPPDCTPGPLSSAELLLRCLDGFDDEDWERMLEAEKLIPNSSSDGNS